MESEFITMLFLYIFTSVIVVLIMSGIDLRFDLNESNSFSSAFWMNTILVFISSIFFMMMTALVDYDLPFIKSVLIQKVVMVLVWIAGIYLLKVLLLYLFDFTFKSYLFIVLIDALLLVIAPFIVYKMLEGFGKAFQH